MPWAITASQPWSSSHRASATVVALDTTVAPVARTRSTSVSAGRPKWKLTTFGASSSTTSVSAASNGVRPVDGPPASASTPSSA